MSADSRLFYSSDCKHFRGDIPCVPHKQHGVHCHGCTYYDRSAGRILIIKLGAAGDVLRTTPLLSPLQEGFPNHEIWWLTETPELVPSVVHKILANTWQNVLVVRNTSFEAVYCLDKDYHACALAASIDAPLKYGFTWDGARPAPANELSTHKFITGLFDDVSKEVRKTYPQEMIEMCGFEWKRQEYVIDAPRPTLPFVRSKPRVVGLNTGCGERWIAREWQMTSWIELVRMLRSAGCDVVLLGGPAEHERNVYLEGETGAKYTGIHPLRDFISVVNQCDVIVTQVTMALHIALALRKRVVLLNNIFNPYEFELYDRGVLLQPELPCQCYFRHECINTSYRCMDHLQPATVFEAVKRELSLSAPVTPA